MAVQKGGTSPAADIRPSPAPRPAPTPRPRPTMSEEKFQALKHRLLESMGDTPETAAFIALLAAMFHVHP